MATWGWVGGGLGPRLNPWNLKKGEGETLQAYRPEPRIPGREQDLGRWGPAPPALIPSSFVEVSPAGPGSLQAAPGPLSPDSGISLAWVLGSLLPPPGKWSGASSETWLWTSPCLNLHLWLGTEWEAFPRDTEGFSVSPAPCHLPSSSSVLTASVGLPICPREAGLIHLHQPALRHLKVPLESQGVVGRKMEDCRQLVAKLAPVM